MKSALKSVSEDLKKNHAILLFSLPEFISTEFSLQDKSRNSYNSTHGELHGLICFSPCEKVFCTFIEIDGSWVQFGHEIKKFPKYEDLVQELIDHTYFPVLLMYDKNKQLKQNEQAKLILKE